tara:strand:+ start:238 stop:606 length:369 start_codon:yes stop_codon:yes gene_type:complete
MALFKGMSTVERSGPPYTLVDQELVKRDLLNELYTKKGERVMRPNFGSIIWDLLMSPNTPDLQEMVKEDIERIVERDPRVETKNINVFVGDNSIRAEVELFYNLIKDTDILYLEYSGVGEEI